MPNPAKKVASDVTSKARTLDLYLQRIEVLVANGELSVRDAERAYAGAYLEFHAYVEGAIERVFLGLLTGRLQSGDRRVKARIDVRSDAVARAVVIVGRRYVDWLPYDQHTTKRAGAFFSSGRPFSNLDPQDITTLDDSCVIRNALAHQSAAAKRRFHKKFVDGKALPPNQRKPPGYLRGFHTIDQTRMNHMLGTVVAVMAKLCR